MSAPIEERDFLSDEILAEMQKPCRRCGEKFAGASWNGRCFSCHDDLLVPYESGEDYLGLGRY